ncbi:hypothetical protein ACKFR8_09735 [Corynebacterium axilliensis]|uniref:hypothetical protein n=1 Tax=Corynebacterium sp. YSMAA5_1_F9 TaxID=3383591 RepID=UPI0038D1E738
MAPVLVPRADSGFGSPSRPASAPKPGSNPGSGSNSGSGFGPGSGFGSGSGFGAPGSPAPRPAGNSGGGSGQGFGSAPAAPASAGSKSGSGFGSPSSPGGFGQKAPAQDSQRKAIAPTTPTEGPWPLLIAAGVSAVIALILLIVAPLASAPTQGLYFGLAIGGWLLAGIVSFIFLGLYTLKNTQRQAETFYIENTTQTLLYRVIMGGSFVLVIVAAVEIAFYVGKAVGA